MNVIFLDYDGVVNIPIFDENGILNVNFKGEDTVNHYQGICWLNKICKETDSKIVIISTWRECSNYKECLYNSGLDKSISVIGRISIFKNKKEGIKEYLEKHKDIKKYIILDDDVGCELINEYKDKLIRTETNIGINWGIYERAKLKLKGYI